MKLKPAIKQQWVSDLRSDQFEQGRGYLQGGPNKFCCLGVLCERLAQQGLIEKELRSQEGADVEEYDGPDIFLFTNYDGQDTLPTLKVGDIVADSAERDSDWHLHDQTWSPTVPASILGAVESDRLPEERVTLAVLNDVYDYTFAQIADLVEEYL